MGLLSAAVALLAAAPAQARHGGLYVELAPSWGFYSTDEVVIENTDDDEGDFPSATFVPALKVGFNLFGWAGAEAHVTGHYWGWPGAEPGGAAYAGGVVRITPLEVFSYILPDDVKVPSLFPPGPVTWKDRPFDLGISFGGGYTLVGEDYAYEGTYFQWGFDAKFYVTPNFAIGIDLPFRHPFYDPFRYSDYADRTGFCTDGEDAYGFVGATKIPVAPTADRAPFLGAEVNARDMHKLCDDKAPSAFFFAPALTITGNFDFGI